VDARPFVIPPEGIYTSGCIINCLETQFLELSMHWWWSGKAQKGDRIRKKINSIAALKNNKRR